MVGRRLVLQLVARLLDLHQHKIAYEIRCFAHKANFHGVDGGIELGAAVPGHVHLSVTCMCMGLCVNARECATTVMQPSNNQPMNADDIEIFLPKSIFIEHMS